MFLLFDSLSSAKPLPEFSRQSVYANCFKCRQHLPFVCGNLLTPDDEFPATFYCKMYGSSALVDDMQCHAMI